MHILDRCNVFRPAWPDQLPLIHQSWTVSSSYSPGLSQADAQAESLDGLLLALCPRQALPLKNMLQAIVHDLVAKVDFRN